MRYSFNTGPRTRKSSGSSSQELCFLFRDLFSFHRFVIRRYRTYQHRFFSSSRHKYKESTNNEGPTLRLSFHPQRFSRSRWFTPPRTTWVCFAPQPRAGFALQGFSLLPSRLRLSPARSLMSFDQSVSQKQASGANSLTAAYRACTK